MLDTLVWVLAIGYVVWVMSATRYQLRTGRIVLPPLFAATLVFAAGILALWLLGVSPLHLLWWFPLSLVLGVVLLTVPLGVHLTMTCLGLLAGLQPQQNSSQKRR